MPRSDRLKKIAIENNSVAILVVLFLFSSLFVNYFFNPRSLANILQEISLYGMIAVGLSVVMMAGAIDLSVGYQAGLSAVVMVKVLNLTGSVSAGIAASLAVGALMGMFNGTIVTRFKISPLIATIAANFIFKGLVFAVTNKESIRSDYRELKGLYGFDVFGNDALSLSVLFFIAVLIALSVFLKYANHGINIYVTGGNAEAGELAGIDTRKTLFRTYILCGLSCSVAGIFMASRSNAAFYTQGAGRDVFAISACVIGGVKMTGGVGTMANVFVGIAIMRVISTVMNLAAVPAAWVDLVSGLLLITVLVIDRYTKRDKG